MEVLEFADEEAPNEFSKGVLMNRSNPAAPLGRDDPAGSSRRQAEPEAHIRTVSTISKNFLTIHEFVRSVSYHFVG